MSSHYQTGEQAAAPSIWRRAQLVFILGALSAFGPLSIDMYLPALPQLAREFGASPSAIQLTLSACLVGLALGQVVAGPLSDTYGRRRPLLIGVGAYAAASLMCAAAPSLTLLTLLRAVQGLAGAAGIVIARAVVRDLHSGAAAARFFSLLMIVSGLAPILAPVVGGQVLQFTSWRGVFLILCVIGILLLLVALGLRETLPTAARHTGGLPATLATFRRLLADPTFVGYAAACGLAFAAMFAYIAGSSFVLQELYGVSPRAYSLLFGTNAFGLMLAGQINGRLVGSILPPQRLLLGGLAATAGGGIGLLILIALGGAGLIGVALALFVVVASLGFVMPNATTLALSGHPRTAGTASALLGVLQYAVGAAAAPLVGLGGRSALPMAIVIAVCGSCALMVGVRSTRHPAPGAE